MVDSSFKGEAHWLRQMASSGCLSAMETLIMTTLPTDSQPMARKDVDPSVEHIKNGALFLSADRDPQGNCNIVAERVKAFAASCRPSLLRVKDSPFLNDVHQRLRFLLQVYTGGDDNQAPQVLVAEAAAQHLIATTVKNVSDSQPIGLSDFRVLDTFSWLLRKEQVHKGWVENAPSETRSPATQMRTSDNIASSSADGPHDPWLCSTSGRAQHERSGRG